MKRIPVLTMLTALLALWTMAVLAAVPQLINFQGILRDGSGNPVANGSYSVMFKIYDAASGGNLLWMETQSVTTSGGLFTTLLGGATAIPDTVFNDSSRYLEIKVAADPPMAPRQKLSSVGYSYVSSQWTSAAQDLFRLNGNVGIGISSPGAKLDVRSSGGFASVIGFNSLGGIGVFGQSISGDGVDATGGSFGVSASGGTRGVYANGGDYGGFFRGTNAGSYGVYGEGGFYGVWAQGTGGFSEAVHAIGPYNGVVSYGTGGTGVFGSGGGFAGVQGVGGSYGVHGTSIAPGGAAVYGSILGNFGTYGGYFEGDVKVERNLVVVGTVFKGGLAFKIDHPLDPSNKYLNHSGVESPDMMNIYNGNVALDSRGEATVQLPDWFGAVNKDFRYQLTAIGAPGPNLYIAEKVSNNQFRIAGGAAGMEVSWQVTGIRQDAYAEAHRIPVEEMKSGKERGKYLHPVEHGVSETLGMHYEMNQKMAAERKQQEEQQAKMETERKLQEGQRAKTEQERLIREQKAKENQQNK